MKAVLGPCCKDDYENEDEEDGRVVSFTMTAWGGGRRLYWQVQIRDKEEWILEKIIIYKEVAIFKLTIVHIFFSSF